MVSREGFAKHIRLFPNALNAASFAATLTIAITLSSPIAAKEAASTSATCPTWFSRLREQIFMHYNYKNSADGITTISASDYNKAWLRTTAFDLKKNAKFLFNAIRENHPQIAFLEKLGFKFNARNGYVIPTMSEISARHETLLKELVANGVNERDLLRPARMFEIIENSERKIISVALAAEPPMGAKPTNDIVSAEDFLRFVADGHWPIGAIAPVNRTEISFAFHDLGHFGSFYRNPDFMRAIKDFARNRVAEGRFGIQNRKTNLIFESLTLGRKDARPTLDASLSRMGISPRLESAPWSDGNFTRALADISDAQIAQEVNAAYTIRHKTIEDLGGARSDAVGSERARVPSLIPYPDIVENPKWLLESAYDAKEPKKKRAAFSKYLAAMDHTTRMDPTEWISELMFKDQLAVDSKIYRYLCDSGIYSTKSIFYDMFCRITGR